MKLPKLKKRYLAIVLAVGVALGVGGVAYAFFGAQGSGTGTASVIPPTPLKVTIHNTNPLQSTNTGTGQHLTFSVANTPGKGGKERAYTPKVKVVSLTTSTYTGDITSFGHGVHTCKASWFTAKVVAWQYDTTPATRQTTLTVHPVTYTLTPHQDIHVTVLVKVITTPTTTQSKCEGKHPAVTLTVK